ncbi:retrovirus-related pol polyprotein from transposon TNT 1-94 [Tanacetum coccineum]
MQTIHVKFDELTTMDSECNNLEHAQNHSNIQDLSEESTPTPTKTDLDDLFAPQIVSTSEEPTYLIPNDLVDESIQEDNVELDQNTFINPFCSPILDEAESSSTNQDPLNMHVFYQQHRSSNKWTKDHPLEQVIGDPTKPVMTRSRLRNDAEICMYALTFDRLKVWKLVEILAGKNIIGVKWIWKNKTDAENMIIRNEYRLVAKGYRQDEGIDFEESLLRQHDLKLLKWYHDDYESTYGGIQFLGDKLASWSSKKQDCTAMSTAKAEYVSLSACFAQVIWIRI